MDGQGVGRNDTAGVWVAGPWVIDSPPFPRLYFQTLLTIVMVPCNDKTKGKEKKKIALRMRGEIFLEPDSSKLLFYGISTQLGRLVIQAIMTS